MTSLPSELKEKIRSTLYKLPGCRRSIQFLGKKWNTTLTTKSFPKLALALAKVKNKTQHDVEGNT